MAVRVRVLPQWLVDLDATEYSSKKTSGVRKNCKTTVKKEDVHHENEISSKVKKEDDDGANSVTNMIEKERNRATKISPRKKNTSSSRLQISSSEEEEENADPPLFGTSKNETDTKYTGTSVNEHTPDIARVKKEPDDDDLKSDDGDVNAKVCEENHEVSTNNENSDVSSAIPAAACDGDSDSDNGNDQIASSACGTSDNSNKINRQKCNYGEACYRKNSQHRQDFSHPGDDDYTTVDNRPECEYGLSCYRKNPLHRQHYKHTKKVQKPRKAKRPKTYDNDSASDDDYDLDDPFINDASSDEYHPSGNDSETDFSAEETGSVSDDSKQPNKDATTVDQKPKKRKRKD